MQRDEGDARQSDGDEESEGRLLSVKGKIVALQAAYAAGPAASLSVPDARQLDAKLGELNGVRGFEGVRPMGLEAHAAAFAPAVPLGWSLVAEVLAAIAAAVAGLALWEILLILAVLLAIIWLLRKAYADPVPVADNPPAVEPKPEEAPKGEPKPEGTVDPVPPDFSSCSPTGLTKTDPIPMTWFKPVIDNFYPRRITLGGTEYKRDVPDRLPPGEPIGVASRYWPRPGKIMQLLPSDRGSGAADFRAVLERYGFDWTGLQADHVQDLEWKGDDVFENLWPMDRSANLSAGARNDQQVLGLCLTPRGSYVMYTIRDLKAAGLYGRYFQLRAISP